jgi:hypothetical protein
MAPPLAAAGPPPVPPETALSDPPELATGAPPEEGLPPVDMFGSLVLSVSPPPQANMLESEANKSSGVDGRKGQRFRLDSDMLLQLWTRKTTNEPVHRGTDSCSTGAKTFIGSS